MPDGDFFWAHMPHWIYPVAAFLLLAVGVSEAIKRSEVMAGVFGRFGTWLHNRGSRKLVNRVDGLESAFGDTRDKLECATAYLVIDANWHLAEDVLVAESYPELRRQLPRRVPFSEFSRRWRNGWRPESYDEVWGDPV